MDYLKAALIENGDFDIGIYKDAISNIIHDNVINYIIDKKSMKGDIINKLLINTINEVVDEDNIFYQLITLNYLHFIILATVIISEKNDNMIDNFEEVSNIIDNNIIKNEITDNFVFKLYDNLKKEVNLYDYVNCIFTYLYKYINDYGDKIPPLLIVNEAMKIFTINKSLTVTKYVIK
jgi:hypothetical protein